MHCNLLTDRLFPSIRLGRLPSVNAIKDKLSFFPVLLSPISSVQLRVSLRYLFLGLSLACPLVTAQTPSNDASTPSTLTPQKSSGPWGTLTKIPIFLEAPDSSVNTYPLPSTTTRWSLPVTDAPNLPTLFASLGLPNRLVDLLTQTPLQLREGNWLHLFPPAEEVANLDPEVRSRLYLHLSNYEVNEYHRDPVYILTPTVEEWYRSSDLNPNLIAAIAKLAYRRGDTWTFSDLPYVLNLAASEPEARRLFQSFTRTRSYLVKLVVSPDTDTESVRSYWSIGGKSFRLKALGPLLNSIKETQQTVELDISHIIPALPRKLIYNYQSPSFATKGIFPDCHWTSLNFFNYEPHEYLLNSKLATSKVIDDYLPVEPPYAYGDILFYLGKDDGNAFHSCLFLADDLVFTKNGRNQLSPWIISTLKDVSSIYLASTSGTLQAYRRKDNFAEYNE